MATKDADINDPEGAAFKEKLNKCWHLDIGEGKLRVMGNPVVSGVSVVLIWLFVILCAAAPDHMLYGMKGLAFQWVPEVWTWLYIASQDIWIVVLLWLMATSSGNIKLGKEDEPPEYSFATWFSMLFSAGVAVGLFYYSVAEPVWHYKGWGGARFVTGVRGYGNNNEDGVHALMITWFHWGLHGWIPYTTMGATLAIMSYRRGFPMTIRYVLWPLIGEECYGWIGDTVDILSIITTIFGVCTSLGLGAMQVNQGLQRIDHGYFRGFNSNVPSETKYSLPACGGTGQECGTWMDENNKTYDYEPYGIQTNVGTQILIIIIITIGATVSVASGLNSGIVNLSRMNFALGMFLLLMVLFLGETWYILDLTVQTFGFYCYYLLKVSFQTDAFEKLGDKELGLGGAPDGKGGGQTWMADWTLFYWGWWISWAPFVGTFLAKISRGRTLRQFIVGTLVVPSLYSFFWFGVFGGEGIRMQRLADASGVCTAAYNQGSADCKDSDAHVSSKCVAYAAAYSTEFKKEKGMGFTPECELDPNYHGGFGKCKQYEWAHMVAVGAECVESTEWVDVPCGDMADPTALPSEPKAACVGKVKPGQHDKFPLGKRSECFVPAPDNIVCLYNQGTNDIFFDQISSYGGREFSDMFAVISMIALVMYFITSSDSGSYVVDIISANGHPDPPLTQRIFWAFTEGATACALLAAGRNLPDSTGSLKALQAASLVTGLPYTFVLFWCSQALYLMCKEEAGLLDVNRKSFGLFIFGNKKWDAPYVKRVAMGLLLPGLPMGKVIKSIGGWPFVEMHAEGARIFWAAFFQILYGASVIFAIIAPFISEWAVVGLVLYFGFSIFLTFLRASVRAVYQIQHGDIMTDFVCSTCVPWFTLAQLEYEIDNGSRESGAAAPESSAAVIGNQQAEVDM